MRVSGLRVVVLALLSCVAMSCGAAEQPSSTIVVGSSDTVQSELLAQIYAGALRSTGAEVRTQLDAGDSGDPLAALDRGDVDVVPELMGELLDTFDSTSEATEADDVFADLNKSLPQGLSVSDYAAAEDGVALVIADVNPFPGAETITDIASRCSQATVSVTAANAEALNRVRDRYGCSFASVRIEADEEAVVKAVEAGAVTGSESVAVGVIRTASSGPKAKDLTALDDDEGAFRPQNVVPLFRDGVLNENEIKAFGVVAGELTTADLADMIGEVRVGARSDEVAARWLGEHNL
ncbi:glycine betaine ABC transporter substrate-binding protein [Rhodococcus sp. H29-C3]|uniref:glycine betaine ABC transporter substrate-binding protein n=1 Tax=Rhodococcus sp. H29-C3 TaxID=3046307 RepID=UPI0024BB1383|nr:glycine betaine ABC transporter substrate-binding protein [Rhodococcus sp. H29-C3]MDJ0358683.1 glycine betaine ABC transporter substrate-binding protein [Rhodococcus sp. H29-C3]